MKRFESAMPRPYATRGLWVVDKIRSWMGVKPQSAPADPIASGPLSIKQVMDAAGLMNQLQQAQAKGANPMTALKPEQLQQLRQMLEAQKRLPGAASNPMLKMLEQQLAAHPGIKPTAATGVAVAAPKLSAAKPASAIPAGQPPHPSHPQSASVAPKPAPPKPAQAAGAPSDGTPVQPDLGPEIEALFAELRAMRIAKNEYKSKYDAQERLTQSALADTARLNMTVDDLRSRLKRAEHEVALVTSDAINLKDQAKDVKSSAKALSEAKQEIVNLRSQLAAAESSSSKAQDTAAVREVRHLKRKIERLRRSSPPQQFAHLCTTALSTVSEEAEPNLPQDFSDAMSDFQVNASNAALTEWPAMAAKCGGERNLCLLARTFWGRMVPLGKYDTRVHVKGDASAIVSFFKKDGRYDVSVETSEHGHPIVTVVAKPDDELAAGAGPTAVVRAWVESQLNGPSSMYTVVPFISPQMLANTRRASVVIDHSRSSGPGGQAANVGETNITATLMIDGTAVARAKSQESRSNHINEQTAREKLMNEGLAKYNSALGRDVANKLRFSPSPVIAKSAWDSYLEPVVPAAGVDHHLVVAMRQLVVNPAE